MKKQTRYFYLFALCLFSSSIVQAAEGLNQESLSLDQALRVAFAHNPKMIEARKSISASKGRWIQSEALPDPQLELSVGGLKKNENGSRNLESDVVTLKQPLDPLGTRFLNARMAHDEVNITKDELTLTWAEVSVQVTKTYSRILAEEKGLEVAKDNLETTRQFLSQVETKFQSGNAAKSDLIRARIEVAKAEDDLLVTEKNLKVSQSEMSLLLGRNVEETIVLSDSLQYEPLHEEYASLTEKALGERADLRIEKTRLSSARKGFWSAVLKTVFPQMSIGIERSTQSFDNDTSLLLEASYPLWGFNLGKVKEAKAEREKQSVHLDAFKRQVGLDVYKAFLEAELSDKRVALQKKSLDEANELLRQITVRYDEGDIAFLAYLENIKTIKETRLGYFNALKNYKEQVALLDKAVQRVKVPEGENLP